MQDALETPAQKVTGQASVSREKKNEKTTAQGQSYPDIQQNAGLSCAV